MPSWGRTSNPQKAVPCLTVEGVGTQSPTWTFNCYMRHGQLSICFPSLHQIPIDVTAGWAASSVGTRPPGPPFNSWVDWSNVSKVSLFKETTTTPKWPSWESNLEPFDYQADVLTTWLCSPPPPPHTHTHIHTHTYTYTTHTQRA